MAGCWAPEPQVGLFAFCSGVVSGGPGALGSKEKGQWGQMKQRTQGSLPWAGPGGTEWEEGILGPSPRKLRKELKMLDCIPSAWIEGGLCGVWVGWLLPQRQGAGAELG